MYVGMRYWLPFTEDAVADIKERPGGYCSYHVI